MTNEDKARLDKITNRVICSDAKTVLSYVPEKSVDLVVSDLPYNQGYEYDEYDDNRPQDEYWDMVRSVFAEIGRILKPNSSIYIKQARKNLYPMMTILNSIANFKNLIIWRNASMSMPKDNFGDAYEILLFYTKGDAYFNQYAERRKSYDSVPSSSELRKKEFLGKMNNLWLDIPRVVAGALVSKEAILEPGTLKKVHSCQMPKKLAERCILFSSQENDIVVDPFSGIFTTASAAKKLNRNFIACDISEKYCKAGEERLKKVDEELRQVSFLNTSGEIKENHEVETKLEIDTDEKTKTDYDKELNEMHSEVESESQVEQKVQIKPVIEKNAAGSLREKKGQEILF